MNSTMTKVMLTVGLATGSIVALGATPAAAAPASCNPGPIALTNIAINVNDSVNQPVAGLGTLGGQPVKLQINWGDGTGWDVAVADGATLTHQFIRGRNNIVQARLFVGASWGAATCRDALGAVGNVVVNIPACPGGPAPVTTLPAANVGAAVTVPVSGLGATYGLRLTSYGAGSTLAGATFWVDGASVSNTYSSVGNKTISGNVFGINAAPGSDGSYPFRTCEAPVAPLAKVKINAVVIG
jgi:hypothetical protein